MSEEKKSLFAVSAKEAGLHDLTLSAQGNRDDKYYEKSTLAWEALEKAHSTIPQGTDDEKKFLEEKITPILKGYIEKAVEIQYGNKIKAHTEIPKLYEEFKASVERSGWNENLQKDVLTGVRLATREITTEGRTFP